MLSEKGLQPSHRHSYRELGQGSRPSTLRVYQDREVRGGGGGCDWWGVPWVFKDSKTGPRKSSRRVSEELLTIRQIRLSREGDAGRTAVGMATSADTDERVCRS